MEITAAIILFLQDAVPVVQSTASAAVQSVQETATVVAMEDSVSTVKMQVVFAYITVYALKFLRNSPWFPLLRDNAVKMNKFVSLFAAFLVSQGISYTFNIATVDEASRVLNIAITFPTTVALMQGMWGWASQYVFQQGAYKWFIVSNEHQGMISAQIAQATGTPPGVRAPEPGVVQP